MSQNVSALRGALSLRSLVRVAAVAMVAISTWIAAGATAEARVLRYVGNWKLEFQDTGRIRLCKISVGFRNGDRLAVHRRDDRPGEVFIYYYSRNVYGDRIGRTFTANVIFEGAGYRRFRATAREYRSRSTGRPLLAVTMTPAMVRAFRRASSIEFRYPGMRHRRLNLLTSSRATSALNRCARRYGLY